MKRKRDRGAPSGCVEASSEDRASGEMSPCPRLQRKHKIFLSHSGHQKEFVECLCEDLEKHRRFPFFDMRSSSLPKGERFPPLILEAARVCEMAVVVISEEYFTSKWPMIELNAIVQARRESNPRLKILPLFFRLSVSEFGDPLRQRRWRKQWSKWADDDPRMKPDEFKAAVRLLKSFNGFEFDQDKGKVVAYRREVVRSICEAISADIRRDDSHVQGRSRLCEWATREKIQSIEPSGGRNFRVLGFYGVGGLGKTTLCKTLCNELSEFEGNVCHIELGANRTSEELVKEVLRKLAGKNEEFVKTLKEDECRHILRDETCWKHRTFLAVDNVWDDTRSLEQAKMFVNTPFHEGSVVMVTSRTRKTLTYAGVDLSHCFEVPELGEDDARSVFLYHAARGREFVSDEDKEIIGECVGRCYFQKGERQGCHYLPLALKVLGMHLGSLGSDPSEWKRNLPKVRQFSLHFPEENPVFSVIRVNFDRLVEADQAMFMDIAFFRRASDALDALEKARFGRWSDRGMDVIKWLSLVHNKKSEVTELKLQELKEKGLLEDVDINSKRMYMHDLYFEFASMESEGLLTPMTSFDNRKWVYASSGCSELERTPSGGCWEKLLRLGVEDGSVIASLQGVQWRYFSNIVVLMLVGIRGAVEGVLNLKELRCLRSLDLMGLDGLERIEGLEDLKNLTHFQCSDDGLKLIYRGPYLGPLPASLKVLRSRYAGIQVGREVFSRCINLCGLVLDNFNADDGVDFSNCKSLQSVDLGDARGLRNLAGMRVAGSRSCFQSLKIRWCKDMTDVSDLEHFVGLQHLEMEKNENLQELPNLGRLTNLQVLSISGKYIAEVPGLGSLQQLRDLQLGQLGVTRLPNLSGLRQLQEFAIRNCYKLASLEGLGDLLALQRLVLSHCKSLSSLPDLSKLTNLEDLNLWGSGVKLQEETICMLAKLPLLGPVICGRYTKVDMVRRRVLECDWEGRVRREKILKRLPLYYGRLNSDEPAWKTVGGL